MKISEASVLETAKYIRAGEGEYDPLELQTIMDAAKAYIASYTGLSADELDEYEDLTLAFFVVCREMHDHRELDGASGGANRVIDSIMSLHRRNLL